MRQKKIKPAFLLKLFFFALVLVVFKAWFMIRPLSAGDWSFLFEENIKEFFFIPTIRPDAYFPLNFFYQSTAKILHHFSFSWPLIERLVWFWPFLILTIFSSWYLAKTLFPKKKIIQFFTPLIYLFNTYILMVVGGGQMGVALGYAVAPFAFAIFAKLIQKPTTRLKIIAGLILAIQLIFDPRISYLTIGAIVLYGLVNQGPASLKKLVLPVLIALGLHSVWLLPMLKISQSALPATYGESGWLSFLSFANFSESFSLLHPNWPENIFGKTYLMRPEFLDLPILAFASLFFANSITLPFVFLALIGAFLAKGSNPPFGQIYVWLFKYFPGMSLFRDASKFYLLTALSFSILIPFTIAEIYCRLPVKKLARDGIFLLFTFYFLFLNKPSILGQLGGTFKAKEVPREYTLLKNFINSQDEFFQVLWVPKKQRFGFYSNLHPALAISNWVEDNRCLEPFCGLKIEEYNRGYFNCYPNEKCFPADASFLANPEVVNTLADFSIKYIIIPYDSEEEIFLWERQCDPEHRQKLEDFLDTIAWFKKIEVADKIAVYKVR